MSQEAGDDPQAQIGQYRLYSRKKNPKTGQRRNLGTFPTRSLALQHERAIQYFKRHQARQVTLSGTKRPRLAVSISNSRLAQAWASRATSLRRSGFMPSSTS